ncbi:ABC-type uncharacterized transport system auxiliary subunit [Pseudomonas silensiensis]
MTIMKRKFYFDGNSRKIPLQRHTTHEHSGDVMNEPFIFRMRPMRLLFVPALAFGALLLAGCASAPNDPTLTLQTRKTPAQYAECVVPKLQGMNPTVTQTQRSYRIVVPSKVSTDNVLEAYKAGNGGKVFIYERHLLVSNLLPSSFERAAQECI